MTLQSLTRASVLEALREYDALGREPFLEKYGFGKARSYFLVHEGKRYDSKAVAGAAHGFLPGQEPLSPGAFFGGEKTVAHRLSLLGFAVETAGGSPAAPPPSAGVQSEPATQSESVSSSEPRPGRNPPWCRDELILALDLYFRHPPRTLSMTHPLVVELRDVLNNLPLPQRLRDPTFSRNANGVYMKVCNFLRLDPSYEGKGLAAGSKADEEVWNEFAGDRENLALVAAAIRKTGASSQAGETAPAAVQEEDDDLDGDEGFPEGRLLERLHRRRERSQRLREEVKRRALKAGGKLACAACGFDFAKVYGRFGEGFIECHHVVPVSELPGVTKTKPQDIALLCANCHRMVHRRRPWLTLSELGKLLAPT